MPVTPIQALRISSEQQRVLVATAHFGQIYTSNQHMTQMIVAQNVALQPGRHLQIGALYLIAADGMAGAARMQFDWTQDFPGGQNLYGFFVPGAEERVEVAAHATADDADPLQASSD